MTEYPSPFRAGKAYIDHAEDPRVRPRKDGQATGAPIVYLQDPDVTLHLGDVLKTLRELPAESVHMACTSPPFFGLRDYGMEGQIGLEATPDEWVTRLVEVFRELRRVLRKDGTLWVELGDSYQGDKQLGGTPWKLAEAMREPYYTGKIRDERERIWLAATIEAEGCLFIHKRKAGASNGQGYERKNDTYGAGLEVASTDRVVAERCLEIAGLGSICEQTPEQNERRKQTIYRWNLRTNECRDIIRELYPHLIAKKHEARLLIGCPSSGEDAGKAHESLKAIHQGGQATIDFPAPVAMFEPSWILRSEIVWYRPNPMPESVTDRPTTAHSRVFLFAKSKSYYYDAEAIREPHKDPERSTGRVESNGHGAPAEVNQTFREGERPREYNPAGRNRRSVWEIPTQPYPEAHFATWPEKLCEPMILAGTSEKGVCPECGAPWERVVEHEKGDEEASVRPKHTQGPRSTLSLSGNGSKEWAERGSRSQTTGWQPTCACGEGFPLEAAEIVAVPATVLDPFCGSGTTMYVARRLGRRSVGIDLSAEYLGLAAKRLQQQSIFA